MTYHQLALIHLATIVPAFLIGTWLLAKRKGTPQHRSLGKIYLALMLFTGVVTLFMPAVVGPRLFNHFGFIHLFSLLTLYSVPSAYLAARRRDIAAHRGAMIGLYVGGLLIAGAFAFGPGRLLNRWLLGSI
jgi:uncharacterized membrane protein